MRVTLAYPYTTPDGVEHAPDETIDLDTDEARRLIGDGFARHPDAEDELAEAGPTFDDVEGARAWLVERTDDEVLEQIGLLDESHRQARAELVAEAALALPAPRTDLADALSVGKKPQTRA